MIPREGQESLGGQRQLIAMGEAGLHWGGGKSRQQATTLGVFILHNPVYHQYIFSNMHNGLRMDGPILKIGKFWKTNVNEN